MKNHRTLHFFYSLGLLLASLAEANAVVPTVSVTVTPNNSPTVVQSGGGNVDLTIVVANSDPAGQGFDLWTVLTLPDGSVRGGGLPDQITLPASWNASGARTELIDGLDPEGLYTYTANIGIYPGTVWSSSSFVIEKAPASPPGGGLGWYQQVSGTNRVLTDIQFVSDQIGWAVGSSNTIIHTTDGGDNWYPQSNPPSSNYAGVHFIDQLNGWVVGSAGQIVHTSDGGNTWTEQVTNTSNAFNGVFFSDANNGWAVGGKPQTFTAAYSLIYGTDDGGISWRRQYRGSGEPPLKKVLFVNKEVGWAIGERGNILRTTSGGKEWTKQSSGTQVQLYDVHFISESEGWIAGRDGILLHTTNAGESWAAVSVGHNNAINGVHFTDSSQGWIITSDGGNPRVMVTGDGGNSWQFQNFVPPYALTSLQFTNSLNGWATDYRGNIYHTTSGGQ